MNTVVASRHSPAVPVLPSQLLESLATAMLLLDGQLRVHYANHAAEQLLATSLSHLRQHRFTDFLDDTDGQGARLLQALVLQQPYIQRHARLRGVGPLPLTVVDYSVTPMPAAALDAEGSAVSEQGLLLVELQPLDRLIHINREDNLFTTNQATHALVLGLAHEIKNPLGGIRGAAQLLERQLDSAPLREYTEVIIHEVERLRKLVDRMLGVRKLPDFKRVNIHQVLERVRLVLQAETGSSLKIVRDYDPSLPEVWADADQLIQVFLNITRNAAQALLELPSVGKRPSWEPVITIRSRVLHQCSIGVHSHALVCQLEIEDNGPGIDRELRETLFYPMVTGRSQGTGLGLPVAQSIMQQHGGLIECDSRPGKTLFKVLLPFHPVTDTPQGGLADAGA